MALYYHNWAVHFFEKKYLSSLIKKYGNGITVDFGCGEKKKYSSIINNGAYFGFDYLKSQHDISGVDYVASVYDSALKTETVDTVISTQVLEHLNEPGLFLNEAWRVLKKDSVLILSTNFIWHLHEEPYDYYRFTQYSIKYLFKKYGFRINEIIFPFTPLFTFFQELSYYIRLLEFNKTIKIVITPILFVITQLLQLFAIVFNFFKVKNPKYYSHIIVIGQKVNL